ncbi:serine/threonine-protein kinase [Sorangium sp. So ce362]|uniref:serine/threonine-protein kinase n=1 Tax=Sorangium sp. So ce362 TaxID=3133303 RepID=UPI003F60FC8E
MGERLQGPASAPPSPRRIARQGGVEGAVAFCSPMNDEQGTARDAPDEPRQLGPYRIIERLGGGGMGVVFRAAHARTGEEVAIKTVRGVNDAGHLAAIRRETRVLRRLNHPGIVRFLDEDVTGGVPWVAMPLLRGGTLRDRLAATFPKDAGMAAAVTVAAQAPGLVPASVRLRTDASAARADARPLGPVLTLIRRLCAPLAYLHGEGLVHHDLKPANIVLQDDVHPVLVDLGIALHFGGAGREELDVDPLAGTVDYIAPEQLLREPVDARADLYALGCILYECVTGRPPFIGDTWAVYEQHCSAPPQRPSRLVPGLPAALDDLILTLLAKDPQHRIQYAADVATKLVALGAEAERDEGPPPRVYLYRPVLAGRTDAVCKLQELAQLAASERRGGIALVLGESGSGKTRLARELSRTITAKRLPLELFSGVCVAPGAGQADATAAMAAPLQPLRATLLIAVDRARASEAEAARLFGGRREVLAAYMPEMRDLGGPSEPAPLPPLQARKRVVAALRETLRALAKAKPLCLILDDLQWADDLTLALLDAFARAEPEERGGVLIVGTYRMEETRPEVEKVASAPGTTSIRLGKLTDRDIEDMVMGMLSPSMPPRNVLDALIRNANGNPFFVAEYLHSALDARELQRDQDGSFSFKGQGAAALGSLQIPGTLDELLARRLDLLDAEARELAAWAAVLGQELDDELLFAGPRGQDAAVEAVAELRARRILEETETGRLRFVHDKLREKIYSQLDHGARAALHRRAGEALEARGADAPVLAHHFAGAGLHDKAGTHSARAAQRAVKVYANGDAVRFYRMAIAAFSTAGAAPAGLTELHEGLGDVLGLVGHQAEARDAYGAALGATSSGVDHARFHRKIGKTWEMHHQHAKALECYRQAETALGGQPERASCGAQAWWNEWIQIHLDRISVHYWLADLARLNTLIETVRPVLEHRGTPLHRAHYLHALTQGGIQRDRFVASAETLRYADECVAAYKAAGAPPSGHWVLASRCSLAIIRMLYGDHDQAEAEMRDALPMAERSGDLEVMTRCLTYLTLIQRRRSLVEGTENLARRTLKLARTEDVREYVGAALANLAWCALQHGELARAEETARDALACWDSLPLVYPFQWLARLPLCWVELSYGRLEDAIAQARAVLDPRQQRLPGRLTKLLETAAHAFAAGREGRACRPLALALRGARHGGYA